MRQIFGAGICPASSESFGIIFESSKNHFRIIFDSGICPESSESFWNHFDSGPARIIRIIGIIFDSGLDPRSKIQDSWEVFSRNLGSSTCPNHPNHFGIIFDSGPNPRFKIQDVWEVFSVNLGSSTCLNHPNHVGIIFDSGPAGIIRIILESFLIRALPESSESLESFLIRAWIQDPRSKIPGRSSQGILDPVLALNHPNHFGIILIRALPESSESLESFLIRAWIQDPRFKIPGRSSQGILDPVLAGIIRIILESFLIRARIQDSRSKMSGRSSQ